MSSENVVSLKSLCKKYNLGKVRRGSVLSEKDKAIIQALRDQNRTVIEAGERFRKTCTQRFGS